MTASRPLAMRPLQEKVLFAFLGYFLLMTYAYPQVRDAGLAWVALTIPAVLLPALLLGLAYAETRGAPLRGLVQRYLRHDWQWLLLAFAVLAPVSALAHGSPADAGAVAVLCLVFVLLCDPAATARLPAYASLLFVACVAGSVASYHLGMNPFGYLPWHEAEDPTFYGISRVSLFPALSDSVLFALPVLAMAVVLRPPLWFATAAVAAYFVYFSSSRTAIAVVGAVAVSELLARLPLRPIVKMAGAVLLIVLVVGFAGRALPWVFQLEQKVTGQPSHLEGWLARKPAPRLEKFRKPPSETPNVDYDYNRLFQKDAQEGNLHVSSRSQLWRDHLKAFASSPVTGVGRRAASDAIQRASVSSSATGSESFLTRILAEFGIVALLFWLALVRLYVHFDRAGNGLGRGLTVGLVVSLLLYGSAAVPYSFVCLFYLSLIGYALNVRRTDVPAAAASPQPSLVVSGDR